MRYPGAEFVPWRYEDGAGNVNFYRGINRPIAVVLHVQQGYATTARQWAVSGHYGASWHYTIARSGAVMQHLDHIDGGYHAGIARLRDDGRVNPDPTWPLWRGWDGGNVNTYTVGIEMEGFSGAGFTPEQLTSLKALCRWLAGELGFPYDRAHFPSHADIALIDRSDDPAPRVAREDLYRYLFEEDEMADPRVDEIVSALGGLDAIRAWNANGNSLLLGYAEEQQGQGSILVTTEDLKRRVAELEGRPGTSNPRVAAALAKASAALEEAARAAGG